MGVLRWLFGSKASGSSDEDKREAEINRKIQYLKSTNKLWKAAVIRRKRSVIPTCSGIYAWYVDSVPPKIPLRANYIDIDERMLLYVGKARNLRRRVVERHLEGSAANSTLR